MTPDLIAALIVGAVLLAWIAAGEYVARRFPVPLDDDELELEEEQNA